MEHVLLHDLTPRMRLDESLHLPGGELVLWRGQAVDETLLGALGECGAAELHLCADAGEAETLALQAGREPITLDEIHDGARFAWGLHEANGRKLLSAGRSFAPGIRRALAASGVEVVFEPASDLAPRLARRRRVLTRRSAPAAAVRLLPELPDRPREDRSSPSGPAGPPRAPGASSPPTRADLKNAILAQAVLASEVEAVTAELPLGLSLDVPRAASAAESAVDRAVSVPSTSVACAIESLSSGLRRDHAAASAVIAVASARTSGLREGECLELAECALLHDAGMAWLGEELVRAKGPLSEPVRRAVRRHPARALKVLSDADGLAPAVALAAFEVHERVDGSGYPLRLRGEAIPPGARLLAATDVFCALASPRPHRAELPANEAMDMCVRLASEGKLDAGAVRSLLRAVGHYPVGSAVWLTTGELARVVATSGDDYDRPVVRVIRTSSGLRPAERRLVDLSADPSRETGVSVARPAGRDETPPGPMGEE